MNLLLWLLLGVAYGSAAWIWLGPFGRQFPTPPDSVRSPQHRDGGLPPLAPLVPLARTGLLVIGSAQQTGLPRRITGTRRVAMARGAGDGGQ